MRSIFPSRREIEGQIRLSAGCDPSCDDRLHKLKKKASLKTAYADPQTNRHKDKHKLHMLDALEIWMHWAKGKDLQEEQ